jgi:hypothetical protein
MEERNARPSARDRLARWFVPALLCAVAALQITLAHGWDLTPWKGGGFGMFASIDRMERRPVHVTIATDAGEWIVDPQALMDDTIRYKRIQSLPDRRTLDRLAERVLGETWWAPDDGDDDAPRIALAGAERPDGVEAESATPLVVQRVSIRVSRMIYDRDAGELTLRTLRTFERTASVGAP